MYPGDIIRAISNGMQPTVKALEKIATAIDNNGRAQVEAAKIVAESHQRS